MQNIPKAVQKLVEAREELRKELKFGKADAIRKQVVALGYRVTDTGEEPRVSKMKVYTLPKESFLAIFGSGEIAESSVKTHRRILDAIGKENPSIVILSTPAGFQPNVKLVCEEIAEFFKKHMQNYHPKMEILFANNLADANNRHIVHTLDEADYIFAGPGSPTYAVGNLRDSLLGKKILERVQQGASLGLSSAAAIAFSKFALPVYEIYKAGFNLYWEEGLNLYAKIFQELSIIPHFNNTEGGKKNDTSYAWMGKARFEKMLRLLPSKQRIWGIDEHTAALVNVRTQTVMTLGKGQITEL